MVPMHSLGKAIGTVISHPSKYLLELFGGSASLTTAVRLPSRLSACQCSREPLGAPPEQGSATTTQPNPQGPEAAWGLSILEETGQVGYGRVRS